MKKVCVLQIVIVLVFCAMAQGATNINWDGGGDGWRFLDNANWVGDGGVGSAQGAVILRNTTVTVDGTVYNERFMIGNTGAGGGELIIQTGASYTATGYSNATYPASVIGRQGQTGVLTIQNGAWVDCYYGLEFGNSAGGNSRLNYHTGAALTAGGGASPIGGYSGSDKGFGLKTSMATGFTQVIAFYIDGSDLANWNPIQATKVLLANDAGNVLIALDVSLSGAAINGGQAIELISYSGALQGTFEGIAEGAIVSLGGQDFQVNYSAASSIAGNSAVILTAVSAIYVINDSPADQVGNISPMVELRWTVVNVTSPTFDINIGTTSACDDILVAYGTGSLASYTPWAGLLNYATKYFWRADATDGGTEYPGTPSSFTTGGKVSDPVPASGGTADRSAGVLSFSGDALIDSYDVWFGVAGDLQFVGNYATASVSFGDLAASIGASVLAESAYLWAVDTKDASGALMVAGDVWDVSFSEIIPVTIEDFENNGNLNGWSADGGGTLNFESVYNSMWFEYSGASGATLSFSPTQSWAATGMDTFVVSFLGSEVNDGAGIILTFSDGANSATLIYPQSDATTSPWWQHWYIRLSDISDAGVVLDSIASVKLSVTGGIGMIRVDDLRLELPGCIAVFQAVGDINKDCSVDTKDLLMLADHWLMQDFAVVPVLPDAEMLLAYYQFDETAGSSTLDSSSNNNNASITAIDLVSVWNTSGYDGGCIELDNSVEVTIPAAVFSGVTGEVTISMWVSGDASDYPDKVNQAIFSAGSASGDEDSWANAAWDIDSADAYGGQWNHYAAVKNTEIGVMSVYHNGVLVAKTTSSTDAMEGSLAGDTVLSMARFDAGISTTVKVDDLRIYGYALSQAEIASLVGVPVTQPIEPIYTEYDLDDDGRISLPDFAVVAENWLE